MINITVFKRLFSFTDFILNQIKRGSHIPYEWVCYISVKWKLSRSYLKPMNGLVEMW